MRIEKKISGVRAFVQAARRNDKSLGLVPTMGALHGGHLALINRSVMDNDITVLSLFVNPTQFGPQEDFAAYPRDVAHDAVLAEHAGAALIFAPEVQEMYPGAPSTTVHVGGLTEGLCGPFRPGHFDGVSTVVAKLLNIVRADRAYFGEKDYQQLQVIRRMVRDLDFDVEIVGVPTQREPDGLAMSSRNAYLKPAERRAAPCLHEALKAGAELAQAGATGGEAVAAAREVLAQEPLMRVQYVEAVDPDTLRDKSAGHKPLLLAAAVYLGDTRLIDNVRVNDCER